MKDRSHSVRPNESERIRDAEFILQARTRISEKIAHGEGLLEVLKAIIETAEEIEPDIKAAILLVDEEHNVLRCGIAPSLPAFYVKAIDKLPIADNVGSCGAAAYRGETVICENLQTDPNWIDYRDLVTQAGLGACWSEPIVSTPGHVLGALSFYSDRPRTPSERELRLARSSANQAAIALERDRSQQALAKANVELEDRVRERTAEAVHANAIKSQFLAAASHDLRQPLHALGLYLSTLDRPLDASKRLDIAQKMGTALKVMGELLDGLLEIAKLESGAVTPQIQNFPIQELLDKLSADNQPLADHKGLALIIESSPSIVRSDPALLQRIVENFVANALGYTDSGSVFVRCQCHDDMLKIDVVDTGIGIPANALDTIFNEYYQLNNSMRDRRKGLGLGLSIVNHIATLLSHRLVVHSVPGEGSTFTVEVPLGDSTVMTTSVATESSLERAAGEPVILLIDDDPLILDATRITLQDEGITVFSADDGNEALEHLKKGVLPDLVISDYRLPNQTGIELVRQLRTITGINLPCILMTGDTFNEELAHANLTNCTILYKPITADQLMSAILRRGGRKIVSKETGLV